MDKITDAFFIAVRKNNIEAVKNYLDNGFNVNTINIHNQPRLMDACAYGYTEMVELFLNHPKININIQDNDGYTALIFASVNSQYHIVKRLLIEPKINIELKNSKGYFFINKIKDKSFLIDYYFQKKILSNGREDILLFFNKYGLVNDKIKEEVPDLFIASEWGLI
jgi:ankyrin repeat protein